MEKEVFENDWKECEYCKRSYYECDTGYSEYECTLDGNECCSGKLEYGCPLSFKYTVE